MVGEIYKKNKIFVRMIKPVGSWNRDGCRHYALWQPVSKFLWFYISDGEQFWLDMYGFEKVKKI